MRSANLIGQERSSDHIDLFFIFQWTRSVFMRGGAIPRGPFTTELLLWYCAMLLWREMDSLKLLTLCLTLTHIFSGRKAKINLQMTPKLTGVMPISFLLLCTDPEIFVRGGGGGGGSTSIWQKSSDNVVVFLFCFLGWGVCAFFLVLSLFYRSQMVNFNEKYHFQGSGGSPIFSRGGGVKLFQGGGGPIAYSL